MISVIKPYRFFDTEDSFREMPELVLTRSCGNGDVNGRSNMILF